MREKILSVLDNSTTYMTIKMKDKIKEYGAAFSVIPNGLTWGLKPLDIKMNKMFKESLRNKNVCYWIEEKSIK